MLCFVVAFGVNQTPHLPQKMVFNCFATAFYVVYMRRVSV